MSNCQTWPRATKIIMQLKHLVFLILGFPLIGYGAISSSLSWKSTYFQATPNQKGISQTYCLQHEPGTFIGMVNEQLKNGAINNRNIKLSNFTFNQHIKDGVYFMYGDLLANGQSNGVPWQDRIKYLAYKLTENGDTYGVWTTPECKGFYRGEVVKTP